MRQAAEQEEGEGNGRGDALALSLSLPCRPCLDALACRDPRFGRNSELPGEDPLLSGTYAEAMVAGMQERDAHGYPKMAALLKHFTA